ncbi:hypothetical protein CLOHAE12215_01101 [Clostridium haemolyticum]|nr:hypothetical protein CLOHAE12215_01101 [Clostridium haemolyticum]
MEGGPLRRRSVKFLKSNKKRQYIEEKILLVFRLYN